MTDQEIEKLREKLGSEYSVKRLNGAITVELADIWKGVEFAECIDDSDIGNDVTIGKVYKCKIVNDELYIIDDKGEEDGFIRYEENFKPSTESAYVEQLRAKAKKLYGGIKDGDRFWIGENLGEVSMYDCEDGFSYWKEEDLLYFGNYAIYSKGKWAKKLPQYIVTPIEIHSEEPDIVGDQVISIRMKIIHGDISQKNRKDVAYHLSKCLEDYLKKIP